MKKLQYQLSNGSWVDVNESRKNEYLDRCVQYSGGIESHTEALDAMEEGWTLRIADEDWYSKCRLFNEEQNKRIFESQKNMLFCTRCGNAGNAGAYPFSTMAGSGLCDDCV